MNKTLTTPAEKKALATELLRLQPQSMKGCEQDIAMALLLRFDLQVQERNPLSHEVWVRYPDATTYRQFSPTSYAADFLYVLENSAVVTGTHPHEDPEQPDVRFWYSAHSFVGQTKAEGFNLRAVVCESLTRRLAHDLEYSEYWNPV